MTEPSIRRTALASGEPPGGRASVPPVSLMQSHGPDPRESRSLVFVAFRDPVTLVVERAVFGPNPRLSDGGHMSISGGALQVRHTPVSRLDGHPMYAALADKPHVCDRLTVTLLDAAAHELLVTSAGESGALWQHHIGVPRLEARGVAFPRWELSARLRKQGHVREPVPYWFEDRVYYATDERSYSTLMWAADVTPGQKAVLRFRPSLEELSQALATGMVGHQDGLDLAELSARSGVCHALIDPERPPEGVAHRNKRFYRADQL